MKKVYEDATSGIVPVDTTPLEPTDKGKEKVGFKRKDAEGTSIAPKKKKKKVTIIEPKEPAMTQDEYDLIAARIQEQMNKIFDAMQTSQD